MTLTSRPLRIKLVLLLASASPVSVLAASLPLWEAGVGMAVLSVPHYRGADNRGMRALPLPYLIYRGEVFKADREGIRTRLFESDRVELNLSANGTLPVDNEDSARRGMRELKPVVEIGPTVNVRLIPSPDGGLSLRLPVRAAMAIDSPLRHVGWVFAPNLAWSGRSREWLPGWNLSVSGGPYFQDRKYNANYYEVLPSEVIAGRPAYSARAGYAGTQLTAGISRRFNSYWVGSFLRYDYLGGAAFENSPLVRTRHAVSVGVAVSWVFGQSSTRVEAPY